MITERIAKPVVKNKFWVVKDKGTRIATIQAQEDGGFVYVYQETREYFPSVQILKQAYHIKFERAIANRRPEKENSVYSYPIVGKAYNQVYDIKRKLPIYSRSLKSKSLYCAGYYLIKINNAWCLQFCPKNITLNRYEFQGPFYTEQEANNAA